MQNETKIFPPKEVAIELKRVGFNELCVGWYIGNQPMDATNPIMSGKKDSNIGWEHIDTCTAPTYDQVIGWFAEVHGIEIRLYGDELCKLYSFEIWTTKPMECKEGSRTITTDKCAYNRQQSLLTAFMEAIKLIKHEQ